MLKIVNDNEEEKTKGLLADLNTAVDVYNIGTWVNQLDHIARYLEAQFYHVLGLLNHLKDIGVKVD